MSDFASAALACFGIESRRTVREKGSYICHTDSGWVRLSKTVENIRDILFAHSVKEYAADKGFGYTDRYFVGPEGLPYVQLGVDRYTATHIAPGRELDFSSQRDVLESVSQIARFHAAARGLPTDAPSFPHCGEAFARGRETLRQAVKQINRQKQRSDFDLLLIRNAPAYEEKINQALDRLNDSPYMDIHIHAVEYNHITHNALKEENIFICEDKTFLTRFTSASVNCQLFDLAVFVRRYFAKCKDNAFPLPRLLDTYNKNNPLPDGSEVVIQALLSYPAPFVKIVEQYHAKRRGWTPAGLFSRMEEVLLSDG
jgi:CotS family spore coat protein